eukprot:CAMPEP_0197673982 /NCGR_PEP_ID=MMETSP1338-20131121/82031_1 /TAXON_ID=43686 ORGANISM="Pelagodinium beii, Strain RCC1491" /NCGR_SAMPLE_ID=MMETSP1338 /ASSEMBLY_ACC=CAM_ASM_000754 /LENGTH=384 /DNA_ID=CAMNT_0043254299 /DNA_START=150 /DNA_END=1304 /DNA_ORIENTATION=+
MSAWPWLNEITVDREEFITHPHALRGFATVLGTCIVFKSNMAYQRYWEAAGALQLMAAKWVDGAVMAITFDCGGSVDDPFLQSMHDPASLVDHAKTAAKGGPVHAEYASDIAHLTSLMHALALQHLRGDNDLSNLSSAYSGKRRSVQEEMKALGRPSFAAPNVRDIMKRQQLFVLGGLRMEEREALELDSTGRELPTIARVSMAESWLMRRMLARQKFEQGESAATSPPILSRLYQVISDGFLWFGVCCKSAEIPFPFPYQNIINTCLFLHIFIGPILVNGIIFDPVLRAVLSFCAVASYYCLRIIGDIMEDPYLPYDPNELPLPALQQGVNMRLFACGVVPGPESVPAEEATGEKSIPVLTESAVGSTLSQFHSRRAARAVEL